MNRTVCTLLACLMLTTRPGAAEPGDPHVPRALAELNRLGTPAAILERGNIPAAAVLGIELHVDSTVRIGIHTRGRPHVHVWEPLYLEDRVRLRAEIDALPGNVIVTPAPDGGLMDLVVTSDSSKGVTIVVMDMPRIGWGRVEQAPDLTTISIAADRPTSAQPARLALPEVTPGAGAPVVKDAARADTKAPATKAALPWSTTASKYLVEVKEAVIRLTQTQLELKRLQPYTMHIGLGAVIALTAMLFIIRLRRRAPEPQTRAPKTGPWIVHTLASKGGSIRDIASQTGLPREAVRLLMHVSPNTPRSAERAGNGRNFPVAVRSSTARLRMAS